MKGGRREGRTGFFGSFGEEDIHLKGVVLKDVALAEIWLSSLANDAPEGEERRGKEPRNAERVAALTTVVIIFRFPPLCLLLDPPFCCFVGRHGGKTVLMVLS